VITLPNALGLFALVNLWTFLLFGLDKMRAGAGSRRVSEGALLILQRKGPLKLRRPL
jgi:uncharacterized membrane protein YsdA (DUF1294 family)